MNILRMLLRMHLPRFQLAKWAKRRNSTASEREGKPLSFFQVRADGIATTARILWHASPRARQPHYFKFNPNYFKFNHTKESAGGSSNGLLTQNGRSPPCSCDAACLLCLRQAI